MRGGVRILRWVLGLGLGSEGTEMLDIVLQISWLIMAWVVVLWVLLGKDRW